MNQYIKNFPPILSDKKPRFDQLINYFMPDVLKMLDPEHMIYPLKEEEAVLNFLKTFEMFAGDFRSPKYKEWNTVKRVQEV